MGEASCKDRELCVPERGLNMEVVLLRVGIDSGAGEMQGPLFSDGSFELVPIPDRFHKLGENIATYGNTTCRSGRLLVDYFPRR